MPREPKDPIPTRCRRKRRPRFHLKVRMCRIFRRQVLKVRTYHRQVPRRHRVVRRVHQIIILRSGQRHDHCTACLDECGGFSRGGHIRAAVEHVAREALDDRVALAEWKPSYKRVARMQGAIALITRHSAPWHGGKQQTSGSGSVRYRRCCHGRGPCWRSCLRTARLAISLDDAGPESRHLLARWGQLHLVRTGLGCAATIAFLLGLISSGLIAAAGFSSFAGPCRAANAIMPDQRRSLA